MISSIQSNSIYNLSSAIMSGYNSVNTLKLTQALSKSNYTVSAATSLATSSLSSDSSKFLKEYQTHMTDMTTAATNVMNPKTATSKLGALSSDSSVAKTSGNLSTASDKYVLNVESIASEQINRSQQMQSSGTLPSLSGRITLKTDAGTKDIYFSAQNASTNKEALESFAAKINEAGAGVTAKTVEKDGKVTLELSGSNGKSFVASGSLAERLGLDQVAQEKQDAVYSVSKNGGNAVRYTSSGNTVTLDGKFTATLQGVGSTNISAGTNPTETLADAMEKLVSSYNSSLTFLDKNSDRGMGVLQQMKRMIMPPTSESSMKMAGITVKADGTYSFDRSAFVEAMKKDSSKITDIAQKIARGIQDDATYGMRQSSSSLLGQSSAQSLSTSSYDTASLSFLSTYNRSGAYNLANYFAIGALMNVRA